MTSPKSLLPKQFARMRLLDKSLLSIFLIVELCQCQPQVDTWMCQVEIDIERNLGMDILYDNLWTLESREVPFDYNWG